MRVFDCSRICPSGSGGPDVLVGSGVDPLVALNVDEFGRLIADLLRMMLCSSNPELWNIANQLLVI